MPSKQADRPKLIRPADRIVFFGDSITEQQLYTNYVESYLVSRYPELKLTFLNAGWAGDTATVGLQRLDRDVLSLKPDLVTVCFGMNDGGYNSDFTEATRLTFRSSMQGIVSRLKAAKVRVLLLTPGFADENADVNLRAHAYSRVTLRALADEVLRLARKERVPAFDMHELMTSVDRAIRRQHSPVTLTMEGVHPNPCGHLVMAFGVLKALGIPRRSHEILLDYRTCRVTAARGVKVRARKEAGGCIVTCAFGRLPFHVEPAARAVLRFLPFEETFNQALLRVTGAGHAPLSVHMGPIRRDGLTRKQLADGINLFSHSSLPLLQAEAAMILRRTNRRTGIYFQFWRELALDGVAGEVYARDVHDLGMRAADLLDRHRAARITRARKRGEVAIIPYSSAAAKIDNGDFMTRWSFAGPFAQPFETDFLGGEAAFSASTAPLDGQWLPCAIDEGNLKDCLREIFGYREFCSCYATATINSPIDQACELRLGSDDGVAAWLNGELLENRLAQPRGVVPDSDRLPVRLQKGKSRLLLKISQFNGAWGFCARFGGLAKKVRIVT